MSVGEILTVRSFKGIKTQLFHGAVFFYNFAEQFSG